MFRRNPRDAILGIPLSMVMEPTTKLLCEKARAGDRQAYDRLFALHADRAALFVRARLGPALREKVQSCDILQDAYLSAYEDFGQFEYTGDEAFLRWLCRIIENRIRHLKDYFSAAKRQAVALPRRDPTGPVTALDRAEHREKLAGALERLDEDHRRVILLRFFEGRSAEEAGTVLCRTAGAVRNLTARALAKLGREMRKP
jgi:RNA polymerase sigma-70 factor, ECF subfamily